MRKKAKERKIRKEREVLYVTVGESFCFWLIFRFIPR